MHALVRNGNCIFAKILHNGATAKEHGRFLHPAQRLAHNNGAKAWLTACET
jgi:hypothetical protein